MSLNSGTLDQSSGTVEDPNNKVQDLSSPGSNTYLSTQGLRTVLDTEVVTKIESYPNFNARFLGEVGKPSDNIPTWTENEPTRITLVTETVLGISRQVVKFTDDTAASGVGAEIPLVAADWTNINAFGASYGGTIRLDTIDDGGFFIGLQDNDVDKRYGILLSNNGGFVKLDAPDSGDPLNITLDGLSGRPKVLFDEWFKMEIVIPQFLVDGDIYINNVLLTSKVKFVTNQGGGGSKVLIGSGSSAATDRTFYVADYGVTIYTGSSILTVTADSMNANNFLVLVPPGKRDYTIQFPQGITRSIGTKFAVLAENVLGKITLTTNPLDPTITFEGLKTITKKVEQPRIIRYVNTINNANNYEHDHQHPTRKIQLDATILNPGDVSYNTKLHVFEVKGLNTTLQVGQELHIPVINKTGEALIEGEVVRVNGYDSDTDRITVTKSLANTLVNAQILGVCTTTMLDNEEGKVTSFGRVNGLDTSSFAGGDRLYLSPFSAGSFTNVKPTLITQQIGHVGKVNATTGYIEVNIGQLDVSIIALISDSTDQTYSANVSKAINFDTNTVLNGMSHSSTVDNDEITFINAGNYYITVEPQYTRTTGGGIDVLNMYLQKDTGSGFVNVANSNIKVTISASGETSVTALTQTISVNAGDTIRIMIQVEDVDLKLDAFVAFGSGADAVPVTPSVICNIHRIGD